MRDAWDPWESQATDPRLALLRPADPGPDAKRPRLDVGAWSRGPCGGAFPLPGGPLAPPAIVPLRSLQMQQLQMQQQAPAEDDITARIVDALKHHLPSDMGQASTMPGLAAPLPHPAEEAAEPELSARLLDSLRTLLPTGESAEVCRSSEAGQELFRVVQSLAPEAAPQPPGEMPVPAQAPAAEAPLLALEAPPPPRFTAVSPPERPPSPREEDAESSDDGVPHRLPPGFGAIPEDLVEERARQREEERVLRLKATQPCRFGRRCKRRDCPNAHPEGREIDTSLNPCAFGRRCKRKGCFYDHPEGRVIDDDPTKGMCKYGVRCSRPDCLYDHPEGRTPLAGPDPRICYFCHDPGHIASDCPRNPESWNYNREAERERRNAVVVQEAQKALAAAN